MQNDCVDRVAGPAMCRRTDSTADDLCACMKMAFPVVLARYLNRRI